MSEEWFDSVPSVSQSVWRFATEHLRPESSGHPDRFSVAIGIGVLRYLAPKEPVNNAEVQDGKHRSYGPPDQSDPKGMGSRDRIGNGD
jgi:hypothetical protein